AAVVAIVAWQAFVRHRVGVAWPVVSAGAFAILALVHARVLGWVERSQRARQLYERGMARLDARWAGPGTGRARHLDGHPFARDLDLFGPASLFQLLDTTRTEVGQDTLAEWLGRGAEIAGIAGIAGINEVRARQAALAELKPKVDFREDLAVLAAEAHVAKT